MMKVQSEVQSERGGGARGGLAGCCGGRREGHGYASRARGGRRRAFQVQWSATPHALPGPGPETAVRARQESSPAPAGRSSPCHPRAGLGDGSENEAVQVQQSIHLALLNSSIEAGILLCGNGALCAMVVGGFARGSGYSALCSVLLGR